MPFDFDFTQDKLVQCISNNTNAVDWFLPISSNLPDYQITSKLRVAAWIAQVGHESGDFRWLTENLNYPASSLMRVWPSLFPTIDIANAYAHQPEKIANRAYGNRMGNGDEASGDGWKFRGRGAIGITGKQNYTNCSQTMYGDASLLDNPDLLSQPDGAVRSACWFWNSRSLNDYADQSDMYTITQRINGGQTGADDRMARYNNALAIL